MQVPWGSLYSLGSDHFYWDQDPVSQVYDSRLARNCTHGTGCRMEQEMLAFPPQRDLGVKTSGGGGEIDSLARKTFQNSHKKLQVQL